MDRDKKEKNRYICSTSTKNNNLRSFRHVEKRELRLKFLEVGEFDSLSISLDFETPNMYYKLWKYEFSKSKNFKFS